MILGVLLSTLHQSSLGTLFLIVPEKLYALWYTPLLPLLFYVSAIAVGMAMTIFESWHSSRAFGRALELPLLASIGRVLAVTMSVYLWIRFLDLFHRHALRLLSRNRIETWLFGLEIALMVIPTILLYQRKIRLRPGGLYACAVMVLFGFVANRLNVATTGLEAGSRHALHPQVERNRGDAFDCRGGLRDLPLRSPLTSPSSSRTRMSTRPRSWKKRRRTQSRWNEGPGKTPARIGRQARASA